MAVITTTASQTSVGEQQQCRTFLAGGAVSTGDAVYLDSAGKVQKAVATALATSQAIGVVIAVAVDGQTIAAANQAVSVCIWGVVYLGESADMTIPTRVYVSATAGKLDQTAPAVAGQYPFIVGYAIEADSIFVDPQRTVPVVVP